MFRSLFREKLGAVGACRLSKKRGARRLRTRPDELFGLDRRDVDLDAKTVRTTSAAYSTHTTIRARQLGSAG